MTERDYEKLPTRELAAYAFNDQADGDRWLDSPNIWLTPKGRSLEPLSPNQLITLGYEADVRRYLYQIIEGVYL